MKFESFRSRQVDQDWLRNKREHVETDWSHSDDEEKATSIGDLKATLDQLDKDSELEGIIDDTREKAKTHEEIKARDEKAGERTLEVADELDFQKLLNEIIE